MPKLLPPATYQGGKVRLADAIVEIILREFTVGEEYAELCCGSAAVTLNLIARGALDPSQVTLCDSGPWGMFWERFNRGMVSAEGFLSRYWEVGTGCQKSHHEAMKALAEGGVVDEYAHYDFLLLQASNFGGKSLGMDGSSWVNFNPRRYWTNGKRFTNSSMPLPDSIANRLRKLAPIAGKIAHVFHGRVEDLDTTGFKFVYIDPPYKGSYGYTSNKLNIEDFLNKVGCDLAVSEAIPVTGVSFEIGTGSRKGGINGKRRSPNREFLSIRKRRKTDA